jgi:hypothetical protein
MLATAGRWEGSSEVVPVNNDAWRALQAWLESAEHRVVIPYAKKPSATHATCSRADEVQVLPTP